jgi:hypothetical protein
MQLIFEEKGGDRTLKNNYSVLLRNGIIPDCMKKRYQKVLNEYKSQGNSMALSFDEITRFNTWFEMHPEKIAGKEIITTSREFPISVKGSEATILMTITKTLQEKSNKNNRLRIAKTKAEAKLKLLVLMKI